MKAVRFTVFLVLMLLLLAMAACLGTDVESGSFDNNGDEEWLDGDVKNGCEGDPDGDLTPDDNNSYKPPLLTDPELLGAVFGSDMRSLNINFGDYYEGWFGDKSYLPYTFDALPGARVTVTLKTEADFASPVLILYGPRNSNGLWGQALTWTAGNEVNGGAALADFQLLVEGQYLILVSTLEKEGRGRYFIGLGCRDQCREPACPDNVCQGFCKDNYRPDGNGCSSCECRASMEPCSSDSDCASGMICENGLCISSSSSCNSDADCQQWYFCDNGFCVFGGSANDGDEVGSGCGCPDYYNPVCGADGFNYSNECLAECYANGVSYFGPCRQEGSLACSFDNDCPENMACIDYVCQSAAYCECQDYFDPVCGMDGLTYNNYCELSCAGVDPAYWGVCQSGWFDGQCRPVCARNQGVSTELWQDPCTGYSYPAEGGKCSDCEAQCLNFDTANEGWYSSCDKSLILAADCLPPCGCDDSWQPVCGSGSVTYSNPCEAACAGAAILYQGACDPQSAGCTRSSDCPVGYTCVIEDDCDGGKCPGYCLAVPTGQECVTDSDCPEGTYCWGECSDPSDPESCYSQCVYDGSSYNPCVVSGCNLELCSEGMQQSYCKWQNEYACLDFARCTIGQNGLCNWQALKGYSECMEKLASAQTCNADGECLSGEYCDYNSLVCLESQCICPEMSDPVCDSEGNMHVNACMAVCAGALPQYYGSCL